MPVKQKHFLVGLDFISDNWYDPTAAVLSINIVRARQLLMAQAAIFGEPRPGVFSKTEILKLCVLANYQVRLINWDSPEPGGASKSVRPLVKKLQTRLEGLDDEWLLLKPAEVTALERIRVDRTDGGEYLIYDDKIIVVVEDRDNSTINVETVDIMPILRLLTQEKK